MRSDQQSEHNSKPQRQKLTLNQHQQFVKERLDKMYSCPPKDEDAEIHKAASSFGYNPPFEKGEKITICPCCELPINTITLPITVSTTPLTGRDGKVQFFVLDSGASMFFTFIKATIIYMSMLFVVSNLYPTHTSYYTNDYCRIYNQKCGDSWFINFSPVKFSETNYNYNYDIMNILNIIMVGASIIFFIFFRKYQYDIYGMLDLHNQTQDDFTVLVKNIPIQLQTNQNQTLTTHEQVLKSFFEDKINDFIKQIKQNNRSYSQHRAFKKLLNERKITAEQYGKVKSVSLCFDLDQMEKLLEQRQSLIEEHLKNGKQKSEDGSQKLGQVSITERIAQLNRNYLELCKTFLYNRSQEFTKKHFIGKAFVSFEFQHYRNYILHHYESHPEEFVINGKEFKVSKATYPSDVFWFNLKIGKWTRVHKIILSYLALLVVLAIVFGVITAIEVGQQTLNIDQSSKQDSLLNKGIGYGYTVLIALLVYWVNYLFGMIIKYMTDRQRHETKTKYLISLIIKMFVAQFLNTAIMYFLLSFRQGQKYLLNDGLVAQISNLLVISGFISVPMNFFQIDSKIQQLWRKFKYGFLYHDVLFQVQYNEINQLPQFDFADRYCYYLVQLFTILFFSYINPICVPAVIIIAILHYWIDKYNLLRCSSNTFPMNFVISRAILKIFELSIVAFAGGNYYFSNKLQGEFSMINFIGLMVAAAYAALAVFSPAYIEDKIFGSQHDIEPRSYTECIEDGSFRQTYWRCNPATMLSVEPETDTKGKEGSIKVSREIGNISDLHYFKSKADSIVID